MLMKIKSWPKLLIALILSQSAGIIGSFFTISVIPTWYELLNKPSFSPPNWIFGPVWTILYTLIGISLYRILIKHEKETFWSVKLFLFHLFLNAIWSPVFFGLKNLGLAFLIIILMDMSLVIMIKSFYKIDKIASILLIPYLLWISFASLLNYSIWRLNPNNTVVNIFAQDFNFIKAREDYVFVEDNYRKNLSDLNVKKNSYRKNPTLSLKEEVRLSFYQFAKSRNNYIRSYLTLLRIKTLELNGLNESQKSTIYSKIDPEVIWYEKRNNDYKELDTLEDIVNKIKEDVKRYENNKQIIYFTLANINLGEIIDLKNNHTIIYGNLKKESNELIKLGRADAGLFDRWFRDIDQEVNDLSDIESKTKTEIDKIYGADEYLRNGGYKKAMEILDLSLASLLKLNGFVKELESVTANKR